MRVSSRSAPGKREREACARFGSNSRLQRGTAGIAQSCVGLRVLYSPAQAAGNRIPRRFAVVSLGPIAPMLLLARTALALL